MANSKRQNAVCNKLSVLTHAEMMQVALWLATVGELKEAIEAWNRRTP